MNQVKHRILTLRVPHILYYSLFDKINTKNFNFALHYDDPQCESLEDFKKTLEGLDT